AKAPPKPDASSLPIVLIARPRGSLVSSHCIAGRGATLPPRPALSNAAVGRCRRLRGWPPFARRQRSPFLLHSRGAAAPGSQGLRDLPGRPSRCGRQLDSNPVLFGPSMPDLEPLCKAAITIVVPRGCRAFESFAIELQDEIIFPI